MGEWGPDLKIVVQMSIHEKKKKKTVWKKAHIRDSPSHTSICPLKTLYIKFRPRHITWFHLIMTMHIQTWQTHINPLYSPISFQIIYSFHYNGIFTFIPSSSRLQEMEMIQLILYSVACFFFFFFWVYHFGKRAAKTNICLLIWNQTAALSLVF